MGAIQSCLKRFYNHASTTSSIENKENEKQYSWDKKREEKPDMANFIIEKVSDTEVGRKPGDINGEQMLIRNCENASIFLFDHINTISVDDCKNCKIFIGPTKTSTFIRDCKDCTIVVAAEQFRTRDCENLNIFLCCPTQPIIESTSGAKFACFQYFYPELEFQFERAGLSPFSNMWWNIHDFTPNSGGPKNWSLIGELYKVHDFMGFPSFDPLKDVKISTTADNSFVPLTTGSRRRKDEHEENSLIVVFADEKQNERVSLVKKYVKTQSAEIELVKSRHLQLRKEDSERIFGNKDHLRICEKGPLIALQFGGPGVVRICQAAVDSVMSSTQGLGLISASESPQKAVSDINNLFNFVDMQLGL